MTRAERLAYIWEMIPVLDLNISRKTLEIIPDEELPNHIRGTPYNDLYDLLLPYQDVEKLREFQCPDVPVPEEIVAKTKAPKTPTRRRGQWQKAGQMVLRIPRRVKQALCLTGSKR